MARVPHNEGMVNEGDYVCFVVVRPPGPDDPGMDMDASPAICRGCVDEGAGCDTAQVAECYRREEADSNYASGEVG